MIVGYDSNGNYIIKNSWGTRWGNNGYGVVSVTNDCALSAYVYKLSSTSPAGGNLVNSSPMKLYKNSSNDINLTFCLFLVMIFISIWI